MKLTSFLLTTALAGCAAFQPGADQAVAVDGILSEAASVARAPAAEQKAVLDRAQLAFVADPSPLRQVHLAALLATLPQPLRDDARAAELLKPLANVSSPGPGRLAAFLVTHIAERQRLARELERAGSEIERVGKERANIERERQASDKERDKREEALRQQLEALRAIERGILDREERLRRKPGGKP